jgi:uncharacterized protein (TIGR00255 family)
VIRSMTGFASVGREDASARVGVTAKSVNHRFLDIAIKAPQLLAGLESRVRALVSQRLGRGRVELTISLDLVETPAREVVLDEALLERIAGTIEIARAKGLVSGTLSASDVVRLPQVLEIRTRTESTPSSLPESVGALVEVTVGDAIDALVVMRETEGRFLQTDLDGRLATLAAAVADVEREARAGQVSFEDRLRERLASLPADLAPDSALLAQEVVRFVARSDIDEELVRLRGHFEHWRALAAGPEPCGRKLDFLVQEMNREINTVGSKAEGSRSPEIVIGAKAELERVREQVQNVE